MQEPFDWIKNDGIANILHEVYSQVRNAAANYGYVDRFRDPEQHVGRSSGIIEHMAIFPKPGKQQEIINIAKAMGVAFSVEKLTAPGTTTPSECIVFTSNVSGLNLNHQIFRQVVRRAIKDEQERTAMLNRMHAMRTKG